MCHCSELHQEPSLHCGTLFVAWFLRTVAVCKFMKVFIPPGVNIWLYEHWSDHFSSPLSLCVSLKQYIGWISAITWTEHGSRVRNSKLYACYYILEVPTSPIPSCIGSSIKTNRNYTLGSWGYFLNILEIKNSVTQTHTAGCTIPLLLRVESNSNVPKPNELIYFYLQKKITFPH